MKIYEIKPYLDYMVIYSTCPVNPMLHRNSIEIELANLGYEGLVLLDLFCIVGDRFNRFRLVEFNNNELGDSETVIELNLAERNHLDIHYIKNLKSNKYIFSLVEDGHLVSLQLGRYIMEISDNIIPN